MPELQVLVVEDESAVRELLVATLTGVGYAVIPVADAHRARDAVSAQTPKLILLDWMLPGMSGLEFAKWLKRNQAFAEIPIIMLSARDDEQHKVQGLEAGVDDYVTKPFSTRELLARIKVLLRRVGADESQTVRVPGGLEIDLPRHRVLAHDKPVKLGPTEFRLLHFFMTHQERVYSRSQLLDLVWGRNVHIEERTVDVHIRRLRKTLQPLGFESFVQTVRGVGYRFSGRDG